MAAGYRVVEAHPIPVVVAVGEVAGVAVIGVLETTNAMPLADKRWEVAVVVVPAPLERTRASPVQAGAAVRHAAWNGKERLQR